MRNTHNDRLSTLVRLLDEKTQAGVVFWEKTGEDGIYEAVFDAFNLKIYKRLNPVDYKAQEDIYIGIYDQVGTLLDEVTDLEIESSLSDAYERMARIYQLARRRALGVDRAIENIIAQLNDSLDFDKRP